MCKLCNWCKAEVDDSYHALYSCPFCHAAATLLVSSLQLAVPGTSPQAVLKLDFEQQLNDTDRLATDLPTDLIRPMDMPDLMNMNSSISEQPFQQIDEKQ